MVKNFERLNTFFGELPIDEQTVGTLLYRISQDKGVHLNIQYYTELYRKIKGWMNEEEVR